MTKVLIVDADASRRASLKRFLEIGAGIILEAEDAAAALRLAREERPDLVLSALSTPGDEGFALLRQLQLDLATRETPLIMVAEGGSVALAHLTYEGGVPAAIPEVPEGKGESQARALGESQTRAMFEQARDAILVVDDEGKYVEINDAACVLTGYARGELLQMGVADLTRPQDGAAPVEAWHSFPETGGQSREFYVRKKNGELVPVEYRAVENFAPGLHMTVLRDVSARKRAEERLTKSETMLAESQAMAHVGSWEFDLATDTVVWSDEQYRLFGMRPRECPISYDVFLSKVHPADRDRVNASIQRNLRERKSQPYNFRVIHPSGSVRLLRSQSAVELDDQGRPVRKFGTSQDITERDEGEGALRRANAKLQTLSRRLMDVHESERRHLARELHDEIGQTLTAAKLNLKALSPGLSAAAASRLEWGIQALDGLLGQVRKISLDLRPPVLDELGIVPALRWLTAQQSQQMGLRVSFTAKMEDLELEPAVKTACFRVAQEALTNAVRHAQARKVAVDLREEADRLWLTIRDDGIGFDPAAMEQRANAGSSFGLLGMKERVLLAGGEITLNAAVGGGAEIKAWFPLAPGISIPELPAS